VDPGDVSPGRNCAETYVEFKARKTKFKKRKELEMARGDRPSIIREQPTPPEWGGLKEEQLKDAVLMYHPAKGERYILKTEVGPAEQFGFKVVGEEVPDVRTEPVKRGPGRPPKEKE
jgi:hypothetical protein